MNSARASSAAASSTASCCMSSASARRTSTRAPVADPQPHLVQPRRARSRRSSMASTAAARSGAESSRVPSRSNITRAGGCPPPSRTRALIPSGPWPAGAHRLDHRGVVRLTEDGRAGDEGVGTRARDLADILDVDPATRSRAGSPAGGIDQGARLAQLVQGTGNEFLAAKAGVDAHQQHHVDLVHHVLEHVQRGGRIEHQAGPAAAILDQLQRAIDVLGGLGMKVMSVAPASMKSPMMRSTGLTIRCTSMGAVTP